MQAALLLRFKPYLPTAFIALVIAYCGFQYLTGDKGFFSQEARKKEIDVKEKYLVDLKAQHKDLEAREAYLRDDNLSKDLLQERARSVLGFSGPNEYVIRMDSKDPKSL